MEEDREQRHCCKFCGKSFPCGRSLGGHMRSHMTMISAETDEHLQKKKAPVDSETHSSSMGHEGGTHVGYGLRENPKKTWRLSDSISNGFRRGKVCKECGKEFPSWNTLFVHMRCHPTDRLHHHNLMDDDDSSWSGGGARKMVSDSQSDNEGGPLPTRRQRRRRTRRSRHGAVSSSSIYEVEKEEEEVAICLMMLSRDVWSWGGLNSAAQSSDNISVDLDIHLSRVEKGITGKNEDLVFNEDESEKMNEPKEEKGEFDTVSDMESAQVERKRCQSFRSEFPLNRVTKAESDDSNDGLSKSKQELSDAELVGDEARFGVEKRNKDRRRKDAHKHSEFELRRDVCKLNGEAIKFGNGWSKENSSGQPGMDFRKKDGSGAYEDEMGQDSHKRLRSDAVDVELSKNRQKKGRFECTTCNKNFHSYQALGGHRASHKRIKGCFASKVESSENSIETDVSPYQMATGNIKSCRIENLIDGMRGGGGETSCAPKKIKGHECPICLKVFSSGQALGGHKRSHMIGNSEARSDASQTIVIQQSLPEVPDMPDLNLPASIDEDSNAQVGFNPWWTGGNHKPEPLVVMISN